MENLIRRAMHSRLLKYITMYSALVSFLFSFNEKKKNGNRIKMKNSHIYIPELNMHISFKFTFLFFLSSSNLFYRHFQCVVYINFYHCYLFNFQIKCTVYRIPKYYRKFGNWLSLCECLGHFHMYFIKHYYHIEA